MKVQRSGFILFLPLLAVLLAAGCSSERGEDRIAYEVRGTVVRVEAARRSVVIDHEAIPGFMEAMTMPFEVRDSSILDGIGKGDRVEFRMLVQGNHAWIASLQKVPAPGGTQ